MKKIKHYLNTLALGGVLMLSLAGCVGNTKDKVATPSPDTAAIQPATETNSTTRIITDARGEVEIPLTPQRIVDISGTSDTLSILGYSVIGTANSDAYDYTKLPAYLEDTLKDAAILGYSFQDTMDLEGVIALEPDLIIISNYQEKMYDQLSQIAPTVMLQMAQIDWTEDLKNVAAVMDQSDKADAWLSTYKAKAAETGDRMKAAHGEDTTYLAFLASGGQIYIFDGAGMGSILYTDMGLKKPEGMPAQENVSLPVVSYEGLAAIDADYIFAVGTEEDLAQLEANKMWQNMRAVKSDSYVTLPASPYFNQGYSPIGRLLFLDEIEGLMK
ncbi:ABC transporter substrate-binding protein [Cellulosilyticum sp. I15G10I2]|uniref:ABC transporter substrate-binding protein n=1 Tax=Cellulosilyticum sp. I15G10I2 TaxID=1892843 RepID=UPI00085C1BED|nr:ABC transporter substrate-binding protein [Cellulosilyticum sp. I15G10I2]